MYDGEMPTESVIIEQLCSDNSGRAESHTDSMGYFSISVGPTGGPVLEREMGGDGNPISVDCEVRARLPGYRSSTISVTSGLFGILRASGSVIFLYPLTEGLTESATSLQAPKDAQKAYKEGLIAVKKRKMDQAEKKFRKSVQIYPKYAAAWLELGKALEKKEKYPEARAAYASALAADLKFVYPYQQLYQIALREQNWKGVVDWTDQLLRLDPYQFPNAYYYNAMAHLELKEYDAAEKNARKAVEADLNQSNPKTNYLLGAILVKKKNWVGAEASFLAYLKAVPDATDKAYVETILGQIDQRIRLAQTAPQDSVAQQKFR